MARIIGFRSYPCFCIVFSIMVLLALIVSCSKPEAYTGESSRDFQESLIYNLQRRNQIISFVNHSNVATIKFVGGDEFRIDGDELPLWVIDRQNCWSLNGISTGIQARIDSLGNTVYPLLSIVDNQWFIDGHNSSLSINSDLINSVKQFQNGIISIVSVHNYLVFYTYGGKGIRVPIIGDKTLIPPAYFREHLLLKEVKAESFLNQQDDDIESYIFFTDSHWGSNQKHSPSIVKHILDFTLINRVFFGGDTITNFFEEPSDALKLGHDFMNAFSFVGNKFYCVIGNHDDNATGQPSTVENHLSDEQVYSYLQSQMADVFYGPYHNFYLDSPKSKTRFLCLDTGRLFLSSKRDHSIQTAGFAISALNTVPEGWHVIAVSHIWTNLVSLETGECKESSYIKPIIDILEDYNSRTVGVFTYNKDKIEYDFSNAKGRVEYCIGGHTHADDIVKSEEGIPLITLTCDGRIQVAGEPSVVGTITEQCVAIVVTDYTDRELHIIHVGRGDDVSISF